MQGWIKLHRQVIDHELWRMERFNRAHAWIDLLLLANHKPNTIFIRNIAIHIERGQLAWSKKRLAERWRWNERTVTRFLKMLEKRDMIHTKPDNLTTLITIINYDLYQGSTEQTTEQDAGESTNRVQTDNNDNNGNNGKNENNLKRDKGADKSALPFSSFKGKFQITQEAVEVVEYYLSQYRDYRGQQHPNLRVTQWQNVVDTLFYCGDANLDVGHELEVDQLIAMIDKHFETEYRDGCDYNILHFNTDGVKANRMYEVAY